MSTSIRIDTTEWISGCVMIGDTGGGVRGSDVPSTGISGAGYAYNDLSLPADANKEICGRITTWPSAGNLFAREDTSFDFTGAPDGVYTFQYQLYVDYVSTGSPATVTLTVGGGSVTVSGQTLTATASLIAGSASGQVNATVAGQVLTAVVSLLPGGAAGQGGASVPGQTLTATASLLPGSATGNEVAHATVNGQVLTATATLIAGGASAGGAAVVAGQILTAIASLIPGRAQGSTVRAPSGSGYPVTRLKTVRPEMTNTKR